ncbi:hypothetical protein MdSGHV004 [Musca domestica salivary gland hypertrophy virus]|uniref:Uncharacterized protein n=1 Tax=Musca hytrovirus(isolate Musca domestica/United States/Boucias/-) TaxID=523909 RepID=B2YFY1_MHVB|nr:hypothetical protein MdSGHV004 [Musca domestica salivary gland hypertrophy virus]ACD03463.1 hypothetical protein MdSGHV004 [Musca domestica salivary gland hypertrophy virus]
MFGSWLVDMQRYVRDNSYGPPAIRVLQLHGITYGIIDPYGYYVMNDSDSIYLLRDRNIAIKFSVRDGNVVTSIVHLVDGATMGFIDGLMTNPPSSATRIEKYVLYTSTMPQRYSVIELLNRCLDMGILGLG